MTISPTIDAIVTLDGNDVDKVAFRAWGVQLEAALASGTGPGYFATSTTSCAIGTGAKVFATQAGLAYSAGARVRLSSAANTNNYMEGVVTSYSGTTLSVAVDAVGGSGTFADWNVNIGGSPGPAGSPGTPGANGAGYGGTSTTSLTIGTGSKAFTTQTGLAYQTGGRVRATSGANWMEGPVASYTGGVLTLTVDKTSGAGTLATWTFNVAGEPGAAGAGSGDMVAANNLNDVASKAAALDNLHSVAEATVASAATTNIGAAASQKIQITGTAGIAAFDSVAAGIVRYGRFAASLTLTHGPALLLPGAANIVTQAGHTFTAISLGSGNWIVTEYTPLPVAAIIASTTQALGVGSVELGHANDTTLSRLAAGVVGVEGVALKKAGVEALWIPAAAMRANTTNGPSSGSVETTTNKNMHATLDFDATTQESAQFFVRMPKSWNEGNISAAFVHSHAATTTNFGVVYDIAAVAYGDGDAGDAAFGTAQQVADTGGTTNTLYVTGATPAMTVAGSPQAEDLVRFRVRRVPADGSDTMAIDSRLEGVTLYVTTDAGNDA